MSALGLPYEFVPPRMGLRVPSILQRILPWYMNRKYGIEHWEVRGASRLRKSVDAGKGIILTPNHSRDSDSLGIGFAGIPSHVHPHFMAGWHVILENGLQKFVIPRAGGFSILREGSDRKAIRVATDLVTHDSRPLIVFPEGHVTRMNDRLADLQDGVALIARQAARRRKSKANPGTTVHPVAIKYRFEGNFGHAIRPKLARLERELDLSGTIPSGDVPRLERIREAIIGKTEIDDLLLPLEKKWRHPNSGSTYDRVRRLRTSILSHALKSKKSQGDLCRDLKTGTKALQLASLQPEYLAEAPSVERYMETLDNLTEDVFGEINTDRPWRMVLEIGEPIEVSPEHKNLGKAIHSALKTQLAALTAELNQPLS